MSSTEDDVITLENLQQKLIEALPELEVRRAKEAGWLGDRPELYALFGTIVLPAVREAFEAGNVELLSRFFSFVETLAICNDKYIVNLLQTTVCEDLHGTDDRYYASLPMLGPSTRLLVDEIEFLFDHASRD